MRLKIAWEIDTEPGLGADPRNTSLAIDSAIYRGLGEIGKRHAIAMGDPILLEVDGEPIDEIGVTPAVTEATPQTNGQDIVTQADRYEKLRGDLRDEDGTYSDTCSHCGYSFPTDELDDCGECSDCAARPEREEARRMQRADSARSEEG